MALNLDSTTVNTDLAEIYLKKYNNFDTFPVHGQVWDVKNYPDDVKEYDASIYNPDEINAVGSSMARKFVEKIKENESTFYQLEYLIRKTDKADFQKYFHLICQHLQCDKDSWNLGDVNIINILMNEKTPLYALGCVAAAKSSRLLLRVITTREMAPICHLFTDLACQIGWTINLFFVNNLHDYMKSEDGASTVCVEDRVCFGCTGVVTESADIDSALDAFINSTVTTPWQLQRIYVQESVYEDVKNALAAKCDRHVLPSCGQAFAAKGKVFACEVLGTERGEQVLVPVEAYRTAKELCALLRQQLPTPALTLWAADSQLAHEVALAAPANLVWINEYATFHGPPASSIPVYEALYSKHYCYINKTQLRDLKTRWTYWNKLTKRERLDTIINALCGLSSAPEGYDSVDDFQNELLNFRDQSFVSVENGKICFGVQRASLFEDATQFNEVKPIKSVLATIEGMAIVGGIGHHLGNADLLQSLEKAGIPLIYRNASQSLIDHIETNILYKKLKVIRSNYGTIFAN